MQSVPTRLLHVMPSVQISCSAISAIMVCCYCNTVNPVKRFLVLFMLLYLLQPLVLCVKQVQSTGQPHRIAIDAQHQAHHMPYCFDGGRTLALLLVCRHDRQPDSQLYSSLWMCHIKRVPRCVARPLICFWCAGMMCDRMVSSIAA